MIGTDLFMSQVGNFMWMSIRIRIAERISIRNVTMTFMVSLICQSAKTLRLNLSQTEILGTNQGAKSQKGVELFRRLEIFWRYNYG